MSTFGFVYLIVLASYQVRLIVIVIGELLVVKCNFITSLSSLLTNALLSLHFIMQKVK